MFPWLAMPVSSTEKPQRHLEVYHAFAPMAKLLRLVGMLPLAADVKGTGLPLLHFRWLSWLTAYSMVPLVLQAVSLWMTVDWYALRISNPVERMTTTLYLTCSVAFGEMVVAASAFRASSHKRYMNEWRKVDDHLDINSDRNLRRYGLRLAVIYMMLLVFGIIMTFAILAMRIMRRANPAHTLVAGVKSRDICDNDMVVFAIGVWLTYNMGTYVLPDFCTLFYARATCLRLRVLRRRLLAATAFGQYEMSEELQVIRIGYRKVLEMVSITCSHHSPTMLITCLANMIQIMMCAHGLLLKQESPNIAWLSLKLFMSGLGALKFSMVCYSGSQVINTAKQVITDLKKMSTVEASPGSKFEVNMLLYEALNVPLGFSVSGFFHLNMTFLGSTVGVVLTYIITIVQFDQSEGDCSVKHLNEY